MDTQTNTDNWLDKEQQSFASKDEKVYEQLPSLVLSPEKDVSIEVDFSNPFHKWTDDSNPKKIKTKAIIPVIVDNKKHNWWLNVKNPAYAELIKYATKGIKNFSIHQTGKLDKTQYKISPLV
jgi:hypothetical protein